MEQHIKALITQIGCHLDDSFVIADEASGKKKFKLHFTFCDLWSTSTTMVHDNALITVDYYGP